MVVGRFIFTKEATLTPVTSYLTDRPHDPMATATGVEAPKKESVKPTRVPIDPSRLSDALHPRPASFADAVSPAVRRPLVRPAKLDSIAARLQAIIDYSEDDQLRPAPSPYAPVRVPRDQIPWLQKHN